MRYSGSPFYNIHVYHCWTVKGIIQFICDKMLWTYQKKYGTHHVLIKLIDSWKCSLDNQNFLCIFLMDLSKAFDDIQHRLLVAKMWKCLWIYVSFKRYSSCFKSRSFYIQCFYEWYILLHSNMWMSNYADDNTLHHI